MPDETILLSVTHLDSGLRQTIQSACERSRLRCAIWDKSTSGVGLPAPSLVVGVLPTGERRIPDDLVLAVTKNYAGLPLLLLSQEPLQRETVVLNHGRVTMIGTPLTVEKISTRLRTLLAPAPVQAAEPCSGRSPRVYRGTRWWAAAIWRDPGVRPTDAGIPLFPFSSADDAGGFIAAVGADREVRLPSELLRRLLRRVEADAAGSAAISTGSPGSPMSGPEAAELQELLAIPSGLVTLSADAKRWSIWAPMAPVRAYLLSDSRLPTAWSFGLPAPVGGASPSPASSPLSTSSDHNGTAPLTPEPAAGVVPLSRRLRRVSAQAGDVLLIHSDPAKSPWPDGPLSQPSSAQELHRAASRGGPALLEHLELTLREPAAPFAAVIIEVR